MGRQVRPVNPAPNQMKETNHFMVCFMGSFMEICALCCINVSKPRNKMLFFQSVPISTQNSKKIILAFMLEDDLTIADHFSITKGSHTKNYLSPGIYDAICTYYHVISTSPTGDKFQGECLASLGFFSFWRREHWQYFAVFSLLANIQVEHRWW